MKKIIVTIAGFIFAGFLSAQTTTKTADKNTNEKSTTSTTTTTTVTKSTPVLKKKLVVVKASKISQADGVIKEDTKTKNTEKKEDENGQPK